MRNVLSAVVIAIAVLTDVGNFAAARERDRADIVAVRSLYEAFAWEAVLDFPASEKDIVDQPRPVLMQYFTPELSDLLLKDRQCNVRTQGICNLDFGPLWDSQDPSGATIQVDERSTRGEVTVKVVYPDHEERKLVFRLQQGSSGWRVSDIVYEGFESVIGNVNGRMSLSQLLSRHLPGEVK